MPIDPGTAAIASAAIIGGSSIAGGLMGGGGTSMAPYRRGIRWRVTDAQKAGIHPLYALGAPTMAPMPSSGSALGEGIARAGQAAGRGLSQYSKVTQPPTDLENASIQHTNAQTDLIKQQIEANRLAQMMQRANQTGYGRGDVTAEMLDMSEVYDPATKRKTMVNTPLGWHYLDPNTVPQRTFEDEYGEIGEVYGVGRYAASPSDSRRGEVNWSKYYE